LESLFGTVAVKAPRFKPCPCAVTSGGTLNPVAEIMPDRCTPEYERMLAKMGALLPYRRARTAMAEFLPLGKPQTVETTRRRTFRRSPSPPPYTDPAFTTVPVSIADIGTDLRGPLFRTIARGTGKGIGKLTRTAMCQQDACVRIARRTVAAAIVTNIGNHSLLALRGSDDPMVEDYFDRGAEMTHGQGALFWELRIALSLAIGCDEHSAICFWVRMFGREPRRNIVP
jgi:hypothetical protein